MKSKKPSEKSHAILEALAKGHSCTQILADDPTLTYRDIFHAAAEMPENQRKRKGSRAIAEGWQNHAKSGWQPAKNEAVTKVRD